VLQQYSTYILLQPDCCNTLKRNYGICDIYSGDELGLEMLIVLKNFTAITLIRLYRTAAILD